MGLFRRKRYTDVEISRPFERVPLMYTQRLGVFSSLRKPLFIIVLLALIGCGWYYFPHDQANESKAAKETELNLEPANSEATLNFLVAEPIHLEDFDAKEHKPFEYEVQGGDTLSGIAEKYNIKLNTILWANDLNARSVIKPGQTLTLLPVDGVLHKIEKGETISEIAEMH